MCALTFENRKSFSVFLLGVLCVLCGLIPFSAFANKVSVRDDRILLSDGQPFFPIGLYYAEDEIAEPSGALLKDLRATGFNTVFFHAADPLSPETKAQLDRIAAAGLRTQFRPPGQLIDSFDVLEKTVAAYKDHPAMLFWEHVDEPLVNNATFEQCEPGYRLMKRLDPDHPVLLVQWPDWKREAELKRFGTICDVYAFDKYPVPLKRWWYQGADIPPRFSHSIAVMGQLTEWWRELAPGKPVLTILQAWNRKPLEDGAGGYPTTAQSRFMAYQSVIRGASGLLYYGKIRVSTPHTASSLPPEINVDAKILERDFNQARALNDAFWAEFKQVVKELDGMTPVFTARDADWKPELAFADAAPAKPEQIEFRVKSEADGGFVILLVNASEHPATVKLSSPRFVGKPIHTWHAERPLQPDEQGTFSDHLAPFDVRVYSDRER